MGKTLGTLSRRGQSPKKRSSIKESGSKNSGGFAVGATRTISPRDRDEKQDEENE
jgi:hypothetical protein